MWRLSSSFIARRKAGHPGWERSKTRHEMESSPWKLSPENRYRSLIYDLVPLPFSSPFFSFSSFAHFPPFSRYFVLFFSLFPPLFFRFPLADGCVSRITNGQSFKLLFALLSLREQIPSRERCPQSRKTALCKMKVNRLINEEPLPPPSDSSFVARSNFITHTLVWVLYQINVKLTS